jgi:lysophospholipase L1-like esterase
MTRFNSVLRHQVFFSGALVVLACGDTGPFADRATVPSASVTRVVRAPDASHVEASPLTTPPTAAPLLASPLVHPGSLSRFFDSLAKLERRAATEDVRIVQFGDSHTAADLQSGVVRRALQARFGDGGRGFVALGKPWSYYVQDGVRGGSTPQFAPEHGHLVHGQFAGDGLYGLGGASILATRRGARAWTDVATPASHIEVAYLEQPGGGSFDLTIDGVKAARVSTSAHASASAFRAFDVTDSAHHVEAEAVGDGAVRIFGLALDRPALGITLDALGINGARVNNALQWSEPHMAEQLRHRAPDLVIYAYGTNEAGDDTPAPVYEQRLVDLLGRTARAVPSAACIFLGPADRAVNSPHGWITMPKLLQVIASQRKVAEAAGCAYYDQLERMGGPGTMATWADDASPKGRRDRVHFTRDGYTQLGEWFAADLISAYSSWRAETAKPPSHLPAPTPGLVAFPR